MEDQNIWYAVIDLIKSALPILGTLGGALSGAYVQNVLSTKKEEKQLKREKLELAYKSLSDAFLRTIRIYNKTEDSLENKKNIKLPNLNDETMPLMDVKLVIDLYLPELLDDFESMLDEYNKFFRVVGSCESDNLLDGKLLKSLKEDLKDSESSLKAEHKNFRDTLSKIARDI